jgi:hypothetical protein
MCYNNYKVAQVEPSTGKKNHDSGEEAQAGGVKGACNYKGAKLG